MRGVRDPSCEDRPDRLADREHHGEDRNRGTPRWLGQRRLMTTPTAASVLAAGHRERGTRQTIGATIVAAPSVPQVSATLSGDAPRETIHATTNVMYAM